MTTLRKPVKATISGTRNGKPVSFEGVICDGYEVRLKKSKFGLKNFILEDGELKQQFGDVKNFRKVHMINVVVK